MLHDLVERREAVRLQVTLRGPVTALAERAVLRTADGLVLFVRTADHAGVEAMTRLLMADGGRIEVLSDPSPAEVAQAVSLDALFIEAEDRARALMTPLASVGGLGGVLRADLEQVVSQRRKIPEAANQIMRMADGRKTVAQLIAAAPYDELLTARIIGKLFDTQVLVSAAPEAIDAGALVGLPPGWELPDRGWGETAELPGEDDLEVEGPDVTGDIATWLSTGGAPTPFMSDAAFAQAFVSPADEEAQAAPRSRNLLSKDPTTSASTRTADFDPETESTLETARPGRRPSFRLVAGVMVVVVAAIGSLLFMGGRGARNTGSTEERADAPPVMTPLAPEAPLSLEPEPDLVGPAPDALRRTISAVDAPADIREAEGLWKTGQFGDAEKVLRRLRAERPTDSTVFVLSGQVFVDTGRLQKANEMANRALELNRQSFRAWVLKGTVQQFAKQSRQALAAYRRALILGPNHEMSDEIRAVVAQLERDL